MVAAEVDAGRALAVVEARPVAVPAMEWTREDLDALRQTVAKDCDDAQFKVFLIACRRLGLDPFARQIVPIVQGGRMTPQTTIDGFRLIAERTRRYGGQIGPQWCGKDGAWHEVWLEDGPPAAARVAVIRRDFDQPMWGVARYKSYAKGGNWGSMPDVMIAKVAESLALRKAFPQELSGVYTDDEMAQDVTPQQPAQEQAAEPAIHPAPKPAPKHYDVAAWEALKQRARDAGVSEDDWPGLCEDRAGTADPSRMTTPGKRALAAYITQLEKAREDAQAYFPDDATDLSKLPTGAPGN